MESDGKVIFRVASTQPNRGQWKSKQSLNSVPPTFISHPTFISPTPQPLFPTQLLFAPVP